MKAPATRALVIALSLALVAGMALTSQAAGSNGSQQSSQNPMGGCCGGQQGSTGR